MVVPPARPLAPPRLHCLGGQLPPADIAADLARVEALSTGAKASLWDALGPCLGETIPSRVESILDQFCTKHGAAGDDVAAVLKALRFLVREAAVRDLSRAVFAEDLAALGGLEGDAMTTLISRYDIAKRLVRDEALRRSLADHGKLLEQITWRADHIGSSSQGERLNAPISLLSFTYIEGDRRERLTLQVLPAQLRELRALCDKLLG